MLENNIEASISCISLTLSVTLLSLLEIIKFWLDLGGVKQKEQKPQTSLGFRALSVRLMTHELLVALQEGISCITLLLPVSTNTALLGSFISAPRSPTTVVKYANTVTPCTDGVGACPRTPLLHGFNQLPAEWEPLRPGAYNALPRKDSAACGWHGRKRPSLCLQVRPALLCNSGSSGIRLKQPPADSTSIWFLPLSRSAPFIPLLSRAFP